MGFFSKTYDRLKKGEERMEDKTPYDIYFHKIEWVDLGHPDVLFAKLDYPLDYRKEEHDQLSINDIDDIKIKLPGGVSILYKNHIKWLQDNCKVLMCSLSDDKHNIDSIRCLSDNGESIYFNVTNNPDNVTKYLLKRDDSSHITVNNVGFGPRNKFSYLGTTKREWFLPNDVKAFHIKLVKLKYHAYHPNF